MVYSLLLMAVPSASCAVVAQLDRALDSDSKGQRFESPRPHQNSTLERLLRGVFVLPLGASAGLSVCLGLVCAQGCQAYKKPLSGAAKGVQRGAFHLK